MAIGEVNESRRVLLRIGIGYLDVVPVKDVVDCHLALANAVFNDRRYPRGDLQSGIKIWTVVSRYTAGRYLLDQATELPEEGARLGIGRAQILC